MACHIALSMAILLVTVCHLFTSLDMVRSNNSPMYLLSGTNFSSYHVCCSLLELGAHCWQFDSETFICIAFICQIVYHYSSLLKPCWIEIVSYYLLVTQHMIHPYANILISVWRSSARFISYANGSVELFAYATFTQSEAASDVVALFARIVFL